MAEQHGDSTEYSVVAYYDPAKPSLDDAKNRTTWASNRINEVAAIQADYERANLEEPVALFIDRAQYEQGGGPVDFTLDWSSWTSAYPVADVSLLFSEVIHHLRSSLESLIHNLAWLDLSGDEPPLERSRQFPIMNESKDWPGALGGALKGLSAAHQDRIKTYQPFSGCTWTASLRDLSNRDKHRKVVRPTSSQTIQLPSISEQTMVPVPGDPTRLRVMATGFHAQLELDDRQPVLPTLRNLLFETANVIVDFQPDFGESGGFTSTEVPLDVVPPG